MLCFPVSKLGFSGKTTYFRREYILTFAPIQTTNFGNCWYLLLPDGPNKVSTNFVLFFLLCANSTKTWTPSILCSPECSLKHFCLPWPKTWPQTFGKCRHTRRNLSVQSLCYILNYPVHKGGKNPDWLIWMPPWRRRSFIWWTTPICWVLTFSFIPEFAWPSYFIIITFGSQK